MAGSITVTKSDIGGAITRYSVAWTADAAGAVSGTSFDIKRGRFIALKFVPGAPAPAAGYTVKLLDPDGADLLIGVGASLAATASYGQVQITGLGGFCEGFSAVTPTVSGAGNLAQGTFVAFVGP